MTQTVMRLTTSQAYGLAQRLQLKPNGGNIKKSRKGQNNGRIGFVCLIM
jgi:hypothetical protein